MFRRWNGQKFEKSRNKALTNNMTIYVKMLGAFVEHRVGSNVKSTFVVTIKDRSLRACHMKVLKKEGDPLKFTRGKSQGPIFSL